MLTSLWIAVDRDAHIAVERQQGAETSAAGFLKLHVIPRLRMENGMGRIPWLNR